VARVADEPGLERHAPDANGSVPAAELTSLADPIRKLPQTQSRTKVIKFSNVSKQFTLHHDRARSFQDVVVSLFGLRTASKRGIPMPQPAREAFWALRDVSFGVYAGEVVGIIGENGSGKSTTLKLITRILEPSSGSVSIKGKVSALLEVGTGFHPELSGRENIFLNGSLLGLSRKEMAERYNDIVDFAEVGEFIDTPVKHYSSGMVMRLGFAVAVHVDPDILLTDEVLAVGDEGFQRKCLDYISTLRKRGVTIIFVSHALEAVRSLCRRVIWLDHGRMIADGPAGEVIDRYLTYENAKHEERLRPGNTRETPSAVAVPLPMDTVADDHHEETIEEGTEDPSVESEAGPVIPDTPGSRWTTGEIQITGVEFIDGEGNETSLFYTGQPLTIRIKYEARKKLERPVFGLALYTENGTQINGPNTLFSGLGIPAIEGTGYVDYYVAELPLLAGRYSVTVAVTGPDTTDIYDHQHQAYSFVVQPTPGLPERYGLFFMPSTWSFHPTEKDKG
jgi:lipopolysaccharide transport system ATP-binding protein